MEYRKIVRILVMVLVFGMTAVVCSGQSTDSRLNGTWVGCGADDEELTFELIFNNGSYEWLLTEFSIRHILGGNDETYRDDLKGTYTTNGNKITFQVVQAKSTVFLKNPRGVMRHTTLPWCIKTQYRSALINAFREFGKQLSLENDDIDLVFSTMICTYRLNGNTLTITFEEDGYIETYTRIN